MAYTFPLTLAQFFDGLPIESAMFDLGEALEMGETGGGEILTADVGARLWKCDVEIALQPYFTAEQIKAKINLLRYAGRSLIVHPIPMVAPQYDPTGSILGGGASAVSLIAVNANNREIKLGGLPVGYQLTIGDKLSFQYGSNPVRYALHEVASNGVADGTGATGWFELTSFIRPGYALLSNVKLIKPEMKAVLIPGSFSAGKSGGQVTQGMKFSLVQTLR